jgi:hypothetical protein
LGGQHFHQRHCHLRLRLAALRAVRAAGRNVQPISGNLGAGGRNGIEEILGRDQA